MRCLIEGVRGKQWLAIGASILLGLVFIVSGVVKLHQGEFVAIILSKSFLTLSQAIIVVRWVPWVELVLGSLLIIGIATKIMASFSAALIVAFIAINSWTINHGLGGGPCGCFGEGSALSTYRSTVPGCRHVGFSLDYLILSSKQISHHSSLVF